MMIMVVIFIISIILFLLLQHILYLFNTIHTNKTLTGISYYRCVRPKKINSSKKDPLRDIKLQVSFSAFLHPTLHFPNVHTHVSTPGLALYSQCPLLQQLRRVQQRSMAEKRGISVAFSLLSLALCSAPAAGAVLSPVLGDGE